MWEPNCKYFSYEEIDNKYKHYCALDGEPKEIRRSIECSRCRHNPDVMWPTGYIEFRYTSEGLQYRTEEYDDFMIEMNAREPIGDIMTGEEFFNHVNNGCLINYDGSLSRVWLNNKLSNLGLAHKGMSQGHFMVDGETWLEICDEFKVRVEWCNK